MGKTLGDDATATGLGKGPLPDPIELILQEHERQLDICSGLEQLISASEAEPVDEWTGPLLSFLTRDLPLHVKDEELDLFPRLNSRRPPDSNLRDILDQLVAEHETDKDNCQMISPSILVQNPMIKGMKLSTLIHSLR